MHGIIFPKSPIRSFHLVPHLKEMSLGVCWYCEQWVYFFGNFIGANVKIHYYTHVKNNSYGTFTLVVKSMLNVNLGGIIGGTQC
jgi:hypothetical protein